MIKISKLQYQNHMYFKELAKLNMIFTMLHYEMQKNQSCLSIIQNKINMQIDISKLI